MLSGDDSFVSNPAQSQLYSYIADDADAVWNDEGDLWAFVPTTGVDDYFDFAARLADEPSRASSSRCRRTSPPGRDPTGPT